MPREKRGMYARDFSLLKISSFFFFSREHFTFCRCIMKDFLRRKYFQLPGSYIIYTRDSFSAYASQDYYSLLVERHRHVYWWWTRHPICLRACAVHLRRTQRNTTQRNGVVLGWWCHGGLSGNRRFNIHRVRIPLCPRFSNIILNKRDFYIQL